MMQGGSEGHAAGAPAQLYREVHKHAYLRHITTHQSKKSSGEQFWVVFCVHCDTVPYLEFYSNQASSVTHQPSWRMCLAGTTSVSGALVPQGKLYRLTLVTRESGIILGAPTWEDMRDWVDTLRAKLREMKILGPGENLYSKPPEQMVRNRAPTRDPTSPLPPPPPGPTVHVPGTEVPTRTSYEDNSRHSESNSLRSPTLESSIRFSTSEPGSSPGAGGVTTSASVPPQLHTDNQPVSVILDSDAAESPERSSGHEESAARDISRLDVRSGETGALEYMTTSTTKAEEEEAGGTSGRRQEDGADPHLLSGSKLKDLSRYCGRSSKPTEANTKVCKDGGLILYNSNSEWGDLSAALRSSITNASVPQAGPSGSRVANISGMSVCLVDKLLPSDRAPALDSDFDACEDYSLQPGHFTNIVSIKRDSQGYTQVDVSNKHTELAQTKLLLPLGFPTPCLQPELVTVTNTAQVGAVGAVTSDTSMKPIPMPRTKLDEGGSVERRGGVYVSLSECDSSPGQGVLLREARERRRNSLNRTSSVPDSMERDHILDTFCGEMVGEEGPANITIIAVTNEHAPYVNVSVTNIEQEQRTAAPPDGEVQPSLVGASPNFKGTIQSDLPLRSAGDCGLQSLEIPEFQQKKKASPSKRRSTSHTKDFYESVFGPFDRSGITPSSSAVAARVANNNTPNTHQTLEDPPRNGCNGNSPPAAEGEYEFLAWSNRSSGTTPGVAGEEGGATVDSRAGPSSQVKKCGLFSRGLTELSIVSKIRTLSTNTRPLPAGDGPPPPLPGTSTQDAATATPKKSGDRTAFTTKLNNIFNKLGGAGSSGSGVTGRNPAVENIARVESSLRRNWSEHNDRTAPPSILRTNGVKPTRPRPPAAGRRAPHQGPPMGDSRRRSNSLNSSTADTEETSPNPGRPVGVLSLREQQVLKLRNEMGHSGGIRLLLSSRDSPDQAVALVDMYSAVWVAGWKQRTHPLLYNALHIGDRLHSVDGCVVSSARQARRAIQNRSGYKVEIIIKRLPHGRVFALKRDSERQDLGLIMEGANITGVAPNSPAQRAGVPPAGTLTEVNGRPLNLLLKKGSTQVKERLSSVGKEVSILVQPAEFVSLLRTALKAVRGCKEYIVQ